MKLTLSVTVSAGLISVPSGREVVAVKSPPTGGFDRSIVTEVPPVFSIVNVFVAVAPTSTDP